MTSKNKNNSNKTKFIKHYINHKKWKVFQPFKLIIVIIMSFLLEIIAQEIFT